MSEAAAIPRIALVGNPNCGKTALFNQLTGSRQKVANYTGVTVERKEGRLHAPSGRSYAVLDLPGAYSLNAASLDEAVTRDLIRGFYPGEPVPDLLVCVVDATNLRLHLRFALELLALGRPMLVALNMVDAAKRRGITIDVAALQRELGDAVAFEQPQGGLFFWAHLTGAGGKTTDAGEFAKKAIEQGVAFVPGAPFYAANPDRTTFRLSFATADVKRIEDGIARLGRAL